MIEAAVLTKVRIQDDAEFRAADQERRDEPPYLGQQSEQPLLVKVDPVGRQQAEVNGDRRDEDGRCNSAGDGWRLPVGIHDV